jgi:hypothetical protein
LNLVIVDRDRGIRLKLLDLAPQFRILEQLADHATLPAARISGDDRARGDERWEIDDDVADVGPEREEWVSGSYRLAHPAPCSIARGISEAIGSYCPR